VVTCVNIDENDPRLSMADWMGTIVLRRDIFQIFQLDKLGLDFSRDAKKFLTEFYNESLNGLEQAACPSCVAGKA
jgi:hypothetical protein